ncbi:hypothetical protein QL285_000953 [Trifolium repens]|nr:hypothetical protein QL285_000953 [Trifolium repens]
MFLLVSSFGCWVFFLLASVQARVVDYWDWGCEAFGAFMYFLAFCTSVLRGAAIQLSCEVMFLLIEGFIVTEVCFRRKTPSKWQHRDCLMRLNLVFNDFSSLVWKMVEECLGYFDGSLLWCAKERGLSVASTVTLDWLSEFKLQKWSAGSL